MDTHESSAPLDVISPGIFSAGGNVVVAALSTRLGGAGGSSFGMNTSYQVGDDREAVTANRARFTGCKGVAPDELAIPGQVHSANVQAVSAPGAYPGCDGLVTDIPRVFLSVSFADCVPVLIFDPVRPAVAAVHAGWRGAAARIASAAVHLLELAYGSRPDDLLVYLGPAAGKCCYAVGPEVAANFPGTRIRNDGSSIYLDLKGAIVEQLSSCGISPAHIELDPSCTICTPHRFHSYRRDGAKSGRMMGFIGLAGNCANR